MFLKQVSRRDRSVTAAILAIALSIVTTGTVGAHVSVNPNQAPTDTNQTFTVRVPTEKNEPTVRVRVEFPAGLTVSRFQPKAGWTRQVEQDAQQRITSATWSGGQIGPNEFEEFVFIGRTPKEAGRLAFKAYQSYQGGETVEWIGAEGTERPGPSVALTVPVAGVGGTDSHGADVAGGVAASKPGVGASPAVSQPGSAGANPAGGSSSGSDLPLVAGLGGLVLGLLALVLSGVALTRRPRAA
jgi:uncharacterized protein YcnI